MEYKMKMPGDDHNSKRNALKTVVAFANREGGTLLFGVEGDEDVGRIVGLAGKPADLRRRLNDLVRDRVSPNPTLRIAGYDVEGKFVIRLDIEPGGGVVHALVLDANRPEYFVRRNGSTYYARPEDLAQIVQTVSEPTLHGIRRFL
ncbi:MAG: AlbA family DNA-binding domain-containing protein [Acidimicrobiales bacterium]